MMDCGHALFAAWPGAPSGLLDLAYELTAVFASRR